MRLRFLKSALMMPIFYALLSMLLLNGYARAGILQALPITGYAYGIDGFNVVGSAGSFGFLYNGSTYSTIRPPGATSIEAIDIHGNRIVGTFGDATGRHGFFFDGATYSTLNHPLAVKGTIAAGLDGNNIVGWYLDGKNVPHGFLYDGANFTTIDSPLGAHGTQLWGISGQKIVGTYLGSFSKQGSFVYDGSSFTNLIDPSGGTLVLRHVQKLGSAVQIVTVFSVRIPIGNPNSLS